MSCVTAGRMEPSRDSNKTGLVATSIIINEKATGSVWAGIWVMGVGLASTRSWNVSPVTLRVAARASLRSQHTRVRFSGTNNHVGTVVCPESGLQGDKLLRTAL